MVCLAKTDGQRWRDLMEFMLVLAGSFGEGATWKPDVPPSGGKRAEYDAWSEAHEVHREAIHRAARQLVRDGQLEPTTPEVYYFLNYRVQAVGDALKGTFTWLDNQPTTIVPFPPLGTDEVAAWYLTIWSDRNAVDYVFPDDLDD